MLICRLIAQSVLLAAIGSFLPAGASAFDPNTTPGEAFRTGYAAYKQGDTQNALEALNFAAEKGHAAALWKLGRMYEDGDGVATDQRKAFRIFSRIANDYADENPRGRNASFVSDAFVTIGQYYRDGVPDFIEADPFRARRVFAHAASYFGDDEAQYNLGRMYLTGEGGEQNARQAARWYKLAAEKGHHIAQADLGKLLFDGDGVYRDPVQGLKWLSIARERSNGDPIIQQMHEDALSRATETERQIALSMASDWITTAAAN